MALSRIVPTRRAVHGVSGHVRTIPPTNTSRNKPKVAAELEAGLVEVPAWLYVDWLLSCFGQRRHRAMQKYREFVAEGKGQPSPLEALRNQIYLGDDSFVEKMQGMVEQESDLSEVPSAQKRKPAEPIRDYVEMAASRNEGIYQAYRSGGYTMKAISDELGLHYSTVSKIIKAFENSRFKT